MRRSGSLILLAILVAVAGCSSTAPSGGPATDDAAEDCSLPSTTPITTTAPTPTDSGTGQASGGVTISSYYDGSLSVVLYAEGTERVAFAERFPANDSTIHLGDAMVDWRSYRVELRSDCTALWERPVYSYEEYRLHVLDNGTVEVVSHGEA